METTKITERLEAWGCRLTRADDKRDPLGRPAGEWVMEGLADDLADYIPADILDDGTEEDIRATIDNEDSSYLVMEKGVLDSKLYWRGYNGGPRGWATNVKLHDVWKYTRIWDQITDHIDGYEEDTFYDWSFQLDWAWEGLIDHIKGQYGELDEHLFCRGGNGGWLIYPREELGLDEVEQLMTLYEKDIPGMVDHLCREIATEQVAQGIADALGTTVEVCEYDTIHFDNGLTISVTYPDHDEDS